ncbi:ABC transporter permease subunit [Marivirga harenae]|uniref:ABC transporter permease n=1 Tax=Marivirga harenae TaxID=2010992 RepID=UPI0026E01270|nr:ABC transporter permease subunit [Marivirga harenae]WKV12463.1 ABC transporter permease subunit [Marivirga harenae]
MKNKGKHIGFVLFVVFAVLPFTLAFGYALLYSFGIIGVVNEGFTLSFWKEVFTSGTLGTSFLYSGIIAAVGVFLSVSLALWVVLKFKEGFNNKYLSFIIYMPLAVPGIVSAFFTYQLFAQSGFFARLSYQLNWIETAQQFPDLVNDNWAIGIIITFISLLTPFFILLYLNIYKDERIEELSQLSRALGANKKQIALKVSLPIMLKKSWVLIVLYFIFLLGAYEVPLILGQESPQMLSVLILRELKQFDLTKTSEGYVMAVVYTVVIMSATIFIFSRKKLRNNAY